MSEHDPSQIEMTAMNESMKWSTNRVLPTNQPTNRPNAGCASCVRSSCRRLQAGGGSKHVGQCERHCDGESHTHSLSHTYPNTRTRVRVRTHTPTHTHTVHVDDGHLADSVAFCYDDFDLVKNRLVTS